MRPYAILLNLEKKQITLQYKDREDYHINTKKSINYKIVTDEVNKRLPDNKELDKLAKAETKDVIGKITKSDLPDNKKQELINEISSEQGIKRNKAIIYNRKLSELKEVCCKEFVESQFERALNNEWLEDIIKIIGD